MWLRALPVLFAAFLASCDGEQGDLCQIDDDCGSGLQCCKPGTSALEARGTCESSCNALPVDDAGDDASSDADDVDGDVDAN